MRPRRIDVSAVYPRMIEIEAKLTGLFLDRHLGDQAFDKRIPGRGHGRRKTTRGAGDGGRSHGAFQKMTTAHHGLGHVDLGKYKTR